MAAVRLEMASKNIDETARAALLLMAQRWLELAN
jgi:hypothetical protein